ncbi:MAG: hypothetical protein AAF802_13320 [Planctomycetota bacterium]
MAKEKNDRENLMRDGVAMARRALMWIDSAEVFIGFRGESEGRGPASLYWNQDPVYQFNSAGQLRRLFLEGRRYKAERGQIFVLDQPCEIDPTSQRLMLKAVPVSSDETLRILAELDGRLKDLAAFLTNAGRMECIGMTDNEFRECVLAWIRGLPSPLAIAKSPSVR